MVHIQLLYISSMFYYWYISNWDSITSYGSELVHDIIGDSDEDFFCDDEDDENGQFYSTATFF